MADNVPVTPPGTKIATDYRVIGTQDVHIQRTDEIGASAIANAQLSVSSTASQLVDDRPTRKRAIFVNQGINDAYIGDINVTISTGMKIPPEASISLHTVAAVYGVTETGTTDIHVVEEFDT